MASVNPIDLEPTDRFSEKRDRIIDAASTLINERGIKGTTFAEVAKLVDMNQNSIAYYFKRKELLVAAAYDYSLGRIEAQVAEAASQPDPRSRVARYLARTIDYRVGLREGRLRPVTVLSELRALDEPHHGELLARYHGIFRTVRGYFGEADTAGPRGLNTVRAHFLLQNGFWLPAWQSLYSAREFARVEARMLEIFDRGIAPEGRTFEPRVLDIGLAARPVDGDVDGEAYLRAATRLINERGYRGASVERIASELNVTKGSFYHHLDAKDDLVLQCFRRSYGTVSRAQQAASDLEGSYWDRISAAISTLLDVQFSDLGPLLRTTALATLPAEPRSDVVARSNRTARRFAGMMIDGITEGSIRPIDPLIASQVVMAMLNSAVDLKSWADEFERGEAIRLYASTLAYGLFDDPSA
ncbi:TetR/AcrR family transcriptional regulator [Sphingopyxis sp. R3-92]|uniref:TetR/AcrR family transcriptional regulator n=1 Tax=Sphingopyxis sp. R3-92 TaxID=3158553 RepID=UPI003EE47EEA